MLTTGAMFAQVPYAGNDADSGVTRVEGFLDPYTGNLAFGTHDIVVAGAVGQRGLTWDRCATSRTSLKEALFGLGHNWAHNWQWEMVDAGQDSQGRAVLSVRLPGGWVHRFTQTSPEQWWPEPSANFRLVAQGDDFTILHHDGGEVHFTRSHTAQGDTYTLRNISDAAGNVSTLTWDGGRLIQVTEPAGRWLKISYASISAPNAAAGVKPYTVINKVVASDGQTVSYKYAFPTGVDYPVLTKVAYPDGTSANYTYAAPRVGTRVLITQIDDPRADRSVRGRSFRYYGAPDAATGQTVEVVTADGSAVMEAIAADQRDTRSYAVRQSNGSIVYRTYNPGGNVAEDIDALGFSSKTTYDVDGRGFKISSTDKLGKITQFVRDSNGYVVKQTAPDGTSKTWKRDTRGRVIAETNELGQARTYTRDEQGRVTRVQHPDTSTEEVSYNMLGQVQMVKDRSGAMTTFTYDARGLRSKITNALGYETTMTYDLQDRVASTTDARGNITRYQHDATGRVVKTILADGTSTGTFYNDNGQVTKSTDASGATRNFVYDAFGRQTSASNALGDETRTEYAEIGRDNAPFGRPIRTISPSGRASAITYDGNGRVAAKVIGAGTPLAVTIRYSYDAAGRRASTIDPRGKVRQFFYDERGRLTKTMSTLTNATTFAYDAAGRKILQTDAKGNTTKWTYDSMGQVSTVTDAKGSVTKRTYDGAGRLASITDAKGNVYRFEYDTLSRLTALVFPDGTRETSTYDAASNRISYTNRAGVIQTFTYDNRNREVVSQWSDGSQKIAKAYDAVGRMIFEDNGVSKLTYSFDAAGRLLAETQDLAAVVTGGVSDPAPRTVSYSYTTDGRRGSLIYPDGSFVKFTYNERGQLQGILGDGVLPPIASYKYDAAGNATLIPRENQTESEIEYDSENQVTEIIDRSSNSHRSPLGTLDYTYDEVGNRTSTTEAFCADGNDKAMRDTYEYDETYQVTRVDYKAEVKNNKVGEPDGTTRFTYDAVGNRVQVSADGSITQYTVNNLNQYTKVGEFKPTYDRNGNLAGMGRWLYTYDALNRLISASDGQTTARFFYDARNRCVARHYQTFKPKTSAISSQLTLNYYDNWNLIEERDAAGVQLARYVFGRQIDEIVVMVNQHGVFYPHRDMLGNVTFLTDVSGKLVERYRYSVEGKVTITDAKGQELGSSAVGNRWMYTGREWLQDVGLYDLRNRVYSPYMGRFLQTDRERFNAGDVNIYRYANNNPVNGVDRYGLWVTWAHNTLVQSAFGGFLSSADISAIEQGSYDTDHFEGSQEPDASFVHAMTAPGQDPADAQYQAAIWVDRCLQNAIDAEANGDHDTAMEWFGAGSHTLMDSTAASHEEFQTWEGVQWYNPISWIEGLVHVVQEIWPSSERRDESDALLNEYYDAFTEGVANYWE
jgi:RHS repeat-associated protein